MRTSSWRGSTNGCKRKSRGCARNWKPRNVPPDAKPPRSPVVFPRVSPKLPGVSLVRPMARTTGGRFRIVWTKRSRYRHRRSAPLAGAADGRTGGVAIPGRDCAPHVGAALPRSGLPMCAVRPESAGASPAANFRCLGGGGGTGGTGGGDTGSVDEQIPGIAARRRRGDSPARLRIDDEPGRDLPGHPTGGAESRSHLARSAECGAAQCAGAYGRDRLEGGGAVALAVGGSDRTGHVLRDSTGARVCRGGGNSGSRVRGLVNPRRLGGVLQVSEGGASKLCGALDPPLPGYGGGGDTGGGPFSVGREATAGRRAGLAGSLPGAADLATGAVDSHRSAGSQTGSPTGAYVSGPGEPPVGQASAPRAALFVHLPVLSGLGGCHQQPSRAGDAHASGHPQELGRQPDRERSAGAGHSHQRVVHGAAAGQGCLRVVDRSASFAATETTGYPPGSRGRDRIEPCGCCGRWWAGSRRRAGSGRNGSGWTGRNGFAWFA